MGGGHTPVELGFRHVNGPMSEFFQDRIKVVNDKLRKAGDSEELSLEHFCALRMYTGPICASLSVSTPHLLWIMPCCLLHANPHRVWWNVTPGLQT